MRKYKLNEDFFENIDSEEKAYFLGFIFADGYVNEKNNIVDITIHNKDREILDKLVLCLYPDGRPLKTIREKYIRLVINSKKIINDLVKHGCMQAKTFKLVFPKIPIKFEKDFIRGYFDGDGCVYISKHQTLNISIIGTIKLLNSIKEILIKNCNIRDTKYDDRYPNKNNNIRALRYGGNIIINRIYHYLYDDSTICLKRKRNKFLDILETKDYFCDIGFSRKRHQKWFFYNKKKYNKSDLAKELSKKTGILATTIRGRLNNDWSVDEILLISLNQRRKIV